MPAKLQPVSGLAQPCALWRVEGSQTEPRNDRVATEEPLEIQLSFERDGIRLVQTVAVTMRTPGHDRELAAGFLFTEGLVANPDQIEAITEDTADDTARVCVSLAAGVAVDLRSLQRHGAVTSACGVCGKTSAAAIRRRSTFSLAADSPTFDLATVHRLPGMLRSAQIAFDETGGLHAAALCDATGEIIALFEDVGRHNAVDKVIGAQLLTGALPLSSEILVVSGRASFELVQKAVMAGLPVLAAVGAPSSLAVQIARDAGLTLIGFMRDNRFNVYSGVARLPELMTPAPAAIGATAGGRARYP
jgi:FdhD protein